jgi:hypothetical protein
MIKYRIVQTFLGINNPYFTIETSDSKGEWKELEHCRNGFFDLNEAHREIQNLKERDKPPIVVWSD